MLCGELPVQADYYAELVYAKLNQDAIKLREVCDEISEAEEQAVMKALERDPKDRYQSAREMRRALQEVGPTTVVSKRRAAPPPVPEPQAPEQDAALKRTARPTFGWSATAGEGGTYVLEYGTDPSFHGARRVEGLQDTHFTPTDDLGPGEYLWRVQAVAEDGGTSDYCATSRFSLLRVGAPWRRFVGVSAFIAVAATALWRGPGLLCEYLGVGCSPSEPPTLRAPVDGAVLNSSDRFQFTWGQVSGSDEYALEYSPDSSFVDRRRVPVTETTHTLVEGLTDGTYYWRVQRTVEDGRPGAYSPVWAFAVTSSGAAPGPPVLVSPANGDVVPDSQHPRLTWRSTTDEQVTYFVEYGPDSVFGDARRLGPTADTSVVLEEQLEIGNVFWRVAAIDGGGAVGGVSEPGRFQMVATHEEEGAAEGMLHVSVNCLSDILVDGELLANDATELHRPLAAGQHTLQVRSEHAVERVRSVSVRIRAGESVTRNFELTCLADVQVLILSVPPHGRIQVDGELYLDNTAPHTLNLPAGTRRISVMSPEPGGEVLSAPPLDFVHGGPTRVIMFDFSRDTVIVDFETP
jgi:hypothetical protein